MKKFTALFITVLLLVSCFAIPANASTGSLYREEYYSDPLDEEEYTTIIDKNAIITFSNNYKTLFLNKEKYVSFSCENRSTDVLAEVYNKINLTDKQKTEVSKISLTASEKGTLIDADIKFKDGPNMQINFIQAKYLSEYKEILTSTTSRYKVYFYYPEDNVVTLSRDQLSGEKTTIENADYAIDDYFDLEVSTADNTLSVMPGYIVIDNDEYYYFDFSENNTDYANCFIYAFEDAIVHKITDPEAVAALEKAKKLYHEDDFGYFLDDNFTEMVANVFLIFIFAIIPFAALVTFIILSIKSRGTYRKINILTSSLLAAELIIFTIIVLIVK